MGTASAEQNYWQKVQERGTINVGILIDWPPYNGADIQGNPQGYDAAVANLLADYYDLDLNFVVVTGPNRIPYLLTDKIDILIASLSITPGRKKQVQFSRPYSAATNVLLGPSSMEIASPNDLVGYDLGVARASTMDIALTQVAPEGTNIQRFGSDATSLQALLVGQVDAVGTSSIIASNIIKNNPNYESLYVINRQLMAIAMRKERPQLLEAMNKFITDNLSNGKLDAAFKKWIGTPLPEEVYNPPKNVFVVNPDG